MKRPLAIWGILACLAGGLSVAAPASSAQNQSQPKSQTKPNTQNTQNTQNKHKAQNKSVTKPNQSPNRKPRVTLSKKQHASVMNFAREHHGELADLLQQLKRRNNNQYKQATSELHADVERLERLRQRSPDRHRLELELWKLDSHIKLLAAQLTMSKKPEVEVELIKNALLKRVNLRLARLRAEQLRLKTRVDRIGAAIDELESQPEEAAEFDWKKLQNSLNKNKKRKNKKRTPEAESPATATTKPPRP